jgi:hypothetical protein
MRHRMIALLSFACAILAVPATALPQVSISVTIAPPDLPVYEQPVCPGDGYIWTPGYWAWGDDDYYWVPGTWVEAPEPGLFWTPAYWGWGGNGFVFYEGYWGPHVGFYGGVNYGYGYFGHGYEGGRWDHDHFFYNRSVNNVDVTIVHNVYNTTVVNNTVTRVSYNGGNGGINARPTAEEETFSHDRHLPPVAVQTQHFQAARVNPQLRASTNHGQPPVAATPKPGAFSDRGVVPATQAGAIHGTGASAANKPFVHPSDLPPIQHPPAPNTGDPKLDQKYQSQQDKALAQQSQERLKLQQKQDQDHQKLAQKSADVAAQQQLELKHQQQTQQLAQQHTLQLQKLQEHQQPPHGSQPEGQKPKS